MTTCVLNLGLKSVRAALFDDAGQRTAIAYRPIETRLGEGIVEQSAELWWSAAGEVLEEVLGPAGAAAGVRHVTVTSSAGCLVPLDAAGRPLRDAIMISDIRARHQAERIRELPAFRELGHPASRMTADLMLPKIAWLRDAEPDSFARTRWFATPNDFLVQRLTGEMCTDAHNAGKYLTGADGDHAAGLLAELSIDPATLPPVATGADRILPLRASVRERFGLPPETRVVLTAYDAICAVYGSGVVEVGDGCDVSGTVSSLRVVTDQGSADPTGRLFTSRHVRPGLYLAGGSNNLAGGVIEWARQVLYPEAPRPYETMVAEACDAPPGAGGLTFLPYLLGERAPLWDANARGVFFGLGRSHGRPDMIRAIFEGVSYSVADIADRLRERGIVVGWVAASGGLARLEPINQIKADMLGVPVRLTEDLETTALGAALLAGVTVGRWPSIEDGVRSWIRFRQTHEPDPARTAMYADFFGLYRGLYERLRELFVERERLISRNAAVLRTGLVRSENL